MSRRMIEQDEDTIASRIFRGNGGARIRGGRECVRIHPRDHRRVGERADVSDGCTRGVRVYLPA